MEKFPTASELRKVSEAEWERRCEEMHKKWLQSIQQGILDAANNGETYYQVECGKPEHIQEIRDIYEPLGYKVAELYDHHYDLNAIIRW